MSTFIVIHTQEEINEWIKNTERAYRSWIMKTQAIFYYEKLTKTLEPKNIRWKKRLNEMKWKEDAKNFKK